MAQGRFALAYMSHDHLYGSHVGLPMVERVNPKTQISMPMMVNILMIDVRAGGTGCAGWAIAQVSTF